MTEKAVKYLSREPVLNADMLEEIRRGMAETVYAEDDGAIVVMDGGFIGNVSASEERTREFLRAGLLNTYLVVGHGDGCLKALSESGMFNPTRKCWQVAWTKDAPDASGPAEVRKLDLSYAEEVHGNYNELADLDDIKERISAGEMMGAFMDGRMVGFIGTHSEGAMGMLFVLPEYRRYGVGQQLEYSLICRELSLGRTPHGQIFEDNEPSIKLAEKLGFEFSGEKMAWFSHK